MRKSGTRSWAIYLAVPLFAFFLGWLVMGGGKLISRRVRTILAVRELKSTLRAKWASVVQAADPLSVGDGPIVLVQFSDYQCPYCRKSTPIIDSVLALTKYRIAYVNFPLTTIHKGAAGAASASICAGEQARFIPMHHALMTETAWMKDSNWTALANVAGVSDIPKFVSCLRSQKTFSRLEQSRLLAVELKVPGTPTYFSAVGPYFGEITVAVLDSIARLSPLVTASKK